MLKFSVSLFVPLHWLRTAKCLKARCCNRNQQKHFAEKSWICCIISFSKDGVVGRFIGCLVGGLNGKEPTNLNEFSSSSIVQQQIGLRSNTVLLYVCRYGSSNDALLSSQTLFTTVDSTVGEFSGKNI